MKRLSATLVVCAASVVAACAQPYDLVIRGGRVTDGTGNPARFADVAVTNGRIAAVGRGLDGAAKRVLDALKGAKS